MLFHLCDLIHSVLAGEQLELLVQGAHAQTTAASICTAGVNVAGAVSCMVYSTGDFYHCLHLRLLDLANIRTPTAARMPFIARRMCG